jgi:hypothetical protein
LTHHDFRRIALSFADTSENAHMGHPDFRFQNRIFATIHTDPQHAMVKLTPTQQHTFVHDHPHIFAPESGAWGRSGSTRVTLSSANEEIVGDALTLAWQNAKTDHAARGPKRSPARSRPSTARQKH